MKTSSLSLLLGSFILLVHPSGTTAAPPLDPCLVGLATLINDPGLNSCLPMVQLSQLLTSPITPALVNTTATALCSRPVCSPASITVVQNTVTQNCVNSTNKATSDLIYGGASLYPPLREGLCQRVSPTNGTFCAAVSTETLTAYLAKHPSPLGVKTFANSTVLKQYVDSVPKDVLCTPCNKAMINPLINYVAQNKATLNAEIRKWSEVIKTQVQAKCGADFTDGVAPKPNNTSGLTGQSESAAIASAQVPAVIMVLGAVFSGAWTL